MHTGDLHVQVNLACGACRLRKCKCCLMMLGSRNMCDRSCLYRKPTDNEQEEECPICCHNYVDFNWFQCCNKPICTECYVRLWQAAQDGIPRSAENVHCPFCKCPDGDRQLRVRIHFRNVHILCIQSRRFAQQRLASSSRPCSVSATGLYFVWFRPSCFFSSGTRCSEPCCEVVTSRCGCGLPALGLSNSCAFAVLHPALRTVCISWCPEM